MCGKATAKINEELLNIEATVCPNQPRHATARRHVSGGSSRLSSQTTGGRGAGAAGPAARRESIGS
jgi:hypothetical protein